MRQRPWILSVSVGSGRIGHEACWLATLLTLTLFRSSASPSEPNLLFLGDVINRAPRGPLLPGSSTSGAFVIVNAENVAGGAGVDHESCRDLFDDGVDVMTSGNHIWRRKEIVDYMAAEPRLLRPANFPPGTPASAGALRLAARSGMNRSGGCSWIRSIARSRPRMPSLPRSQGGRG
jgi:hypothetical protein